MNIKDWWEDVSLPLHAALDKIGEEFPRAGDDRAFNDKRVDRLLELAPFLKDLVNQDERQAPYHVGGPFDDPWQAVLSSTIDAYRYNPECHNGEADLFVRFHDGRTYRYKSVPIKVISDFIEAESKGKFLHSEIKGRYDTEKLT